MQSVNVAFGIWTYESFARRGSMSFDRSVNTIWWWWFVAAIQLNDRTSSRSTTAVSSAASLRSSTAIGDMINCATQGPSRFTVPLPSPPNPRCTRPGVWYCGRVAREWSKSQRSLLAVVVLSALVVLGDIIALNVAGEVSSEWWVLAVPVGLLLVPLTGIVCLVRLLGERRRA